MKKTFTFVSLLTTIASAGQTIPLDSFYIPGTTWTIAARWDSYGATYHGRSWGYDGIVYRIEGDTLVSGVKYHQISLMNKGGYRTSVTYPSPPTFGYYTSASAVQIFGRIRTDSEKVYFTRDFPTPYSYGYPIGVEHLLYDFNLSLSDTITVPYMPLFTVAAIDSVSLPTGQYIKRYTDTAQKRAWLYGIGEGLPGYRTLMIGPGNYYLDQILLCYDNPAFSYHLTYPDETLLGQLESNCFDIVTLATPGIADVNNTDPVIYPNPANGNDINIKYTGQYQLKGVAIYDATGREIYSFDQTSHNNLQHLYAPLPYGTYLVKIIIGDNILMKKLIRL